VEARRLRRDMQPYRRGESGVGWGGLSTSDEAAERLGVPLGGGQEGHETREQAKEDSKNGGPNRGPPPRLPMKVRGWSESTQEGAICWRWFRTMVVTFSPSRPRTALSIPSAASRSLSIPPRFRSVPLPSAAYRSLSIPPPDSAPSPFRAQPLVVSPFHPATSIARAIARSIARFYTTRGDFGFWIGVDPRRTPVRWDWRRLAKGAC
jgi:hypothetical protein